MQNISGYGILVNILASKTFPVGLLINQFADDSDPLDVPVYKLVIQPWG